MAATGTTTILGAGIIGVSTAYYLAQHQPPSTIHLVEPSPTLFSSASGFAAGFLARDWFSHASSSLGQLSFDEHRRLASVHDGATKWGYRGTTSLSYEMGASVASGEGRRKERGEDWLFTGASRASVVTEEKDDEEEEEEDDKSGVVAAPSWLVRQKGDAMSRIGDASTTAQLDPRQLCQFLLDECLRQGVHLHHPARATAVMADTRGELSSVRLEDTASHTETDVPCTRLVIAAGAWSGRVFAALFPQAAAATTTTVPIASLAGHSLLLQSRRFAGVEQQQQQQQQEKKEKGGLGSQQGCHAIFTTKRPGYSPEMFSRAGGEIWLGGLNSSTLPLPNLPAERELQPEAIAELKETATALLGGSDQVEVLRESLCFRPVTPDGNPIIARIGDEFLGRVGGEGDRGEGISTRPGAEGGVFLAAGHGPWGISQSLGTGLVLAEMVQGRELSADVSMLGMR